MAEYDDLLAQAAEARRLKRLNAAIRLTSANQAANDPSPRSLDEALGGTYLSDRQRLEAATPVVQAAAQNEQYYYGQNIERRIREMQEAQQNYRALVDAQIAARGQDATSNDRRADRRLEQALAESQRIWRDMQANNRASTQAQAELAAVEEKVNAQTEAIRSQAMAEAQVIVDDVWAVAKAIEQHVRDTGNIEIPPGADIPPDVAARAMDAYYDSQMYGDAYAVGALRDQATSIADKAAEDSLAVIVSSHIPVILDPERAASDKVAMLAELSTAYGIPVDRLLKALPEEDQALAISQWQASVEEHRQRNIELDEEERLNTMQQRQAAASGGAKDVGLYLDNVGDRVGAPELADQELSRVVEAPAAPKAPSAPAAPRAPGASTDQPATARPAQTQPPATGTGIGSTTGSLGQAKPDTEPTQEPAGMLLQLDGAEYQTFAGQPPGEASQRFVWLLDTIDQMPDQPPALYAKEQILKSPDFQQYMKDRGYTDPTFAYAELGREARRKAAAAKRKDRAMRRMNIEAGLSPSLVPGGSSAQVRTLGGPPGTGYSSRKVDLDSVLG